MIINFKHKYIFVFPPKTGSTTLSWLLRSPEYRGVPYATGIAHVIDHHWPWPPRGTDEYKLYLSVRHPLARAVSQYRHYVRAHGNGHPAARSFAGWVERLEDPGRMPHPHWAFTCWRWLPEALRPRLAGVVRCERMREDLQDLGIARPGLEVPRLNVGRGPIPELSEDLIGQILEWGRDDLERFGYDRDGLTPMPTPWPEVVGRSDGVRGPEEVPRHDRQRRGDGRT